MSNFASKIIVYLCRPKWPLLRISPINAKLLGVERALIIVVFFSLGSLFIPSLIASLLNFGHDKSVLSPIDFIMTFIWSGIFMFPHFYFAFMFFFILNGLNLIILDRVLDKVRNSIFFFTGVLKLLIFTCSILVHFLNRSWIMDWMDF